MVGQQEHQDIANGNGEDNREERGREEELPAAAAAAAPPVLQDQPQPQPPPPPPPQVNLVAETLRQQLPPFVQPNEILYPGDPRRMLLTNDEIRWALVIKAATLVIPELDPLSDYMCAQLAIIERDNVFGAISTATALQALREEYKFIDSYQDGVRGLRKVIQANPRKFLNFSFSDTEGRYVLIHDVCQRVSDVEDLEAYMAGGYYLYQTMTMDFESIRRGVIVLIECEGYDWRQKRSWVFAKKMFTELVYYYPLKGEFRHFHNGMIFNIWASMLKKMLPDRLGRCFHSGCQMDSRLDELFLLPTPEAANERIMERMRSALELRYRNEKTFSLPL